MVLTGMKLGVNKLIAMFGRDLTRRMYAASLETSTALSKLSATKRSSAISRVAVTLKWHASKSISTTMRVRRM